MTISDVVQYFGGVSDVAKALGISYQAVAQWVANDKVPEGRQWQIQAITRGKLKAATQAA